MVSSITIMAIPVTSSLEMNRGDKLCLLCHVSDSCLAIRAGCTKGGHYLCGVCFEAVDKIGSSRNGCLLCSVHPMEELSNPAEPFNGEVISGNVKLSPNEIGDSPCIKLGMGMFCTLHPTEFADLFCISCNRLVCNKCVTVSCSSHQFAVAKPEFASGPRSDITTMLEQARSRTKELETSMREAEDATMQLRMQFSQARLNVDAAYAFFYDQLRDRRVKLLNEIDGVFNSRWQLVSGELQEVRMHIDNLQEFANVIDTVILGDSSSPAPDSVLMPLQAKLKSSLDQMLAYQPRLVDATTLVGDLEFVSNRQSIQIAVQNCLGYMHQGEINVSEGIIPTKSKTASLSPIPPIPDFVTPLCPGELAAKNALNLSVSEGVDCFETNMKDSEKISDCERHQSVFWPNDLGGYVSENDSILGNGTLNSVFSAVVGAEKKLCIEPSSRCDAWSLSTLTNSIAYPSNDSLVDGLVHCGISPIPVSLSTIKRQKMGYHCKFGEFGTRPGQFTEPSGIATSSLGDIIVADTNNHRLEVFDGTGIFKYEILGRQTDCELVYPNRLAVCRSTGDIVVTERSPTHQVQIFDRCGNFLRRFGGKVLQHPRGVAMDTQGRIVVVECRVMRVVIFDVSGAVINRFSLMGELEFPNGVAVDDNEHIYISDNRAHCIKVYNYTGTFIRSIGGAGITNYPIGVGVDRFGHVVVADNHNNFNVTVFNSDGTLIRSLESRVKHAHCYDMALTGDGDIVVSSKDFRIYVYRYDAPIASTNPPVASVYS